MSTVFWVRHGPTHEKSFVGWRDVPADLSDTEALRRLSDYLPSDALVVSSDLIRTVATADAIMGDRHRLPHDPQLREFNFGQWDGMTFGDIAEAYPQLSRDFWERPGDIAPPGGESWVEVTSRVGAAVEGILAQHPSTPIIAVAHIGVIMSQIAVTEDKDAYAAMSYEIDNLSVTEVTYGQINRLGPVNHRP